MREDKRSDKTRKRGKIAKDCGRNKEEKATQRSDGEVLTELLSDKKIMRWHRYRG